MQKQVWSTSTAALAKRYVVIQQAYNQAKLTTTLGCLWFSQCKLHTPKIYLDEFT